MKPKNKTKLVRGVVLVILLLLILFFILPCKKDIPECNNVCQKAIALNKAHASLPQKQEEIPKPLCKKVNVDYARNCGSKDLRHLISLEEGECVEFEIDASSDWNASNVKLEKDAVYTIQVTDEDATWMDAFACATPNGGWCEEPTLLVTGFLYAFGWTQRYEPYKFGELFKLIGVIATTNNKKKPIEFLIGMERKVAAEVTGEFCSYANDLSFKYSNNSGSLPIRITRNKIP